jgi:hypothetical protein
MAGLEGIEAPTYARQKQNRGGPWFFSPLLGTDMGREARMRRGNFYVAHNTGLEQLCSTLWC